MAPMTDYEEQIRGINHIRDTVINETTRNVCYNQTIYNDMRLEMSEYVGLTLTVRDSSVRTEINATYDQVTIQILDDDSKFTLCMQSQCMHKCWKEIYTSIVIVVSAIYSHNVLYSCYSGSE